MYMQAGTLAIRELHRTWSSSDKVKRDFLRNHRI